MSLFNFTDEENVQLNGRTIKSGADIITPNKTPVNVVTDYAWTVQPKESRKDVPYLFMIERKLTNDVMIQQLYYNIVANFELGKQAGQEVLKTIKDLLGDDASESNIEEAKIKAEAEKSNIYDSEDPYIGLYSLEDTGWTYILPYFDDKNHSIDGTWGLPGSDIGLASNLLNSVSTAVSDVATDTNRLITALGGNMFDQENMARPGTYIEKAKQYNFQSKGPSYSLHFNLYNTGDISDVINNWELCFALMYNLLPNRRTKTVFDPPPLYEIHIPGVRRSPISFIKGMKVDFLGARRLMDLDVAGKSSFRTIVPDSYSITIDIEDVLPESKNFMESMINDDKRIRVSSKKGESVSRTFEDNLKINANNITHITLNPTQKNGVTKGNGNSFGDFVNDNITEPINQFTDSVSKTVKEGKEIFRGVL